MSNAVRPAVVLGLVLAALTFPAPAADPPSLAKISTSLTLPVDPKQQERLAKADDAIRDKAWPHAVRALQDVLDVAEDSFVEVKRLGPNGQEATAWVSAATEAERRLAAFPAAARQLYEDIVGPQAAARLRQALTDRDDALVAAVARRYLFTAAGLDALQRSAIRHVEQNRAVLAAGAFERLLGREAVADWSPDVLAAATRAFRAANDPARAAQTWEALAKRVGKDELPRWERDVARPVRAPAAAGARGGMPFLEKRWSVATIREEVTRQLIVGQAVRAAENRGQAVLPAYFPIAADGKLVFRSHWGIHAVELTSGKLVWETDSKWSFDRTFHKTGDGRQRSLYQQWAQQHVQLGRPALLLENSILGQLNADDRRVYAIDDLPVPPHRPLVNNPWDDVNDAVYHNRLQAWNLQSGKLIWEAGGRAEKDGGELNNTFFLGPPFLYGGKLYVVVETNQVLRLVCLEPERGAVVWRQPLGTAPGKVQDSPARRVRATPLTESDGVLVCVTNAGAVVGVDAVTPRLLWSYTYIPQGKRSPEEEDQIRRGLRPPPPGWQAAATNANEWKVTAPVISDGRVVFAAPDGDAVHCLNLRDGALIWKATRQDEDLYLGGVIKGKVLVVGKSYCRALHLTDGKPAWQIETGLPSGRGVAGDGVYYLPLKAAHGERGPGVCSIDVERGATVAFAPSRRKETPGNLLFAGSDVVSQTVDEVAAFPLLRVKLAQVDRLIAANPKDPDGLTGRAELKLDQGDLAGAVADLCQALANRPAEATRARARRMLYEALTEWLQRDFPSAEQYLEEYRPLLAVDDDAAESGRRRLRFLMLLGHGRERQGRARDALRAYFEMAALAEDPELLAWPDEPGLLIARPTWVAGRIAALLGRATPDQRNALEEEIADRGKAVRGGTDVAALRRFVTLFGAAAAGRAARLELAEQLMRAGQFAEAELHLLTLRHSADAATAARAVEALIRWCQRQGLLTDAVSWYRVLGQEFAAVAVRDGKTGADLLRELATDKTLAPHLFKAMPSAGTLQGKVESGVFQQQRQMFTFEPEADALPFFQKYGIALDVNFHQLQLLDRAANEKAVITQNGQPNVTRTNFQQFMYQYNPNQSPRFPYRTVGHLVILPVAHMVFAIDPIQKKVLWEKNLSGPDTRLIPHTRVMVDPRDGSLQIVYQDGWVQKLGQTGPTEANYVCLQTRDGLLAVDPLTGKTLWTRNDVSTRAHIFGDDQHVYVVEMNSDGNATATRALRASDGVSVKGVADFAAVYQNRQRVLGRTILTSDTDRGKLLLRLYDVPTGKDLWKQEFPSTATVLRSEVPHLGGVVEPDGKVTVVDLNTRQTALQATMDPKHLVKVRDVTLLRDGHHVYLAVNGEPEPGVAGGTWSNLMPGSGMRSVPVNGMVYAFARDTGKLQWRAAAPQQMLVLDHFPDLPVLLFTSRYQKMVGGAGRRFLFQSVAVRAINKRNGKLVYDNPDLSNNTNQFYALNWDDKLRQWELVGYNVKFTLTEAKKE